MEEGALTTATRQLQQSPVFDTGRLKAGGLRELRATLRAWEARGLRARVAVLPKGADLTRWRGLWSRLALDPARDLLLITNGRRWEARGWGLDAKVVAAALDRAETGLARYLARGLVMALDELGGAARGAGERRTSGGGRPEAAGSTPPVGAGGEPPRESSGFFLWGAGGLLLAGVGFMVYRRQKLSGATATGYRTRFEAAEQLYADLMLESDAIPEGDDLVASTVRLKGDLDRIHREAAGNAGKMSDPVILGRIDQIVNELSALRTRLIQRGG